MTADRVPELVLADRIDFAIRRDSVLNPDEIAARGPHVLRGITLAELVLDPGNTPYAGTPPSTLANREELWPS